MGHIVSISSAPNDTWLISNRGFWKLEEVLLDRHRDDERVLEQIEIASAIQGVSLKTLSSKDPAVARRVWAAYRDVAQEIVDGKQVIPAFDNDEMRKHFAELLEILNRWGGQQHYLE